MIRLSLIILFLIKSSPVMASTIVFSGISAYENGDCKISYNIKDNKINNLVMHGEQMMFDPAGYEDLKYHIVKNNSVDHFKEESLNLQHSRKFYRINADITDTTNLDISTDVKIFGHDLSKPEGFSSITKFKWGLFTIAKIKYDCIGRK